MADLVASIHNITSTGDPPLPAVPSSPLIPSRVERSKSHNQTPKPSKIRKPKPRALSTSEQPPSTNKTPPASTPQSQPSKPKPQPPKLATDVPKSHLNRAVDSPSDQLSKTASASSTSPTEALKSPTSASSIAPSTRTTGSKAPKKKKTPQYHYTSAVWVGGAGGGIAMVDRKYMPAGRAPAKRAVEGSSASASTAAHGSGSGSHGHARSSSFSSATLTASSTNTSSAVASERRDEQPFTMKFGRRYLRDPSLAYPLPADLAELHRQILRTMLMVQVFGGPVCSPNFEVKPPKKVLEVGCGSGYWSSLCHMHFAKKGFSVSFTGLDVAPLAAETNRIEDMKWRFVQHDLRKMPLPFKDEEFELVMMKDMSLVTSTPGLMDLLMDEYLRILKPGGTLEIWDGDHTLRMLLPQAQRPPPSPTDSDSEDEEQELAEATGTYILNAHIPLTAPQNQYLTDYNTWISKALESRQLSSMPCTLILPLMLQEADLTNIENRRLAIPLGEVRWEREGIGSTVPYSTKGKEAESGRKTLTATQSALRRTALLTVTQMIESLEPILREASGKGQDEWDRWTSDMLNDLMLQNGTSWGECLEVGSWWATKRKESSKKARAARNEKLALDTEKPMPFPPDPHPGALWNIPGVGGGGMQLL
jgi:ubiquinone/menaquinone biosynthesis C-methylase UbiE